MRLLPFLFNQRLVFHTALWGFVQSNLQSGENLARHGAVQGIELLGSVELNAAKTIDRIEQNIISLISGKLFRDLCGHLSGISGGQVGDLSVYIP